jgi:uncharacterized alkaline shock family protein YloU
MSRNDDSYLSSAGRTTIAPAVLITITRLTALAVPGVTRLAPGPGRAGRIFRRGLHQGILLEVNDSSVSLELHLAVAPEANVREVAGRVQADVARAIQETVGMQVGRIDVHIEDVDYGFPAV